MMHETSRGHTLNNDVGFPLLYLATSQKYQTIDGLWLTLHCLQINWTLQMYFDWAGSMCVSRYGGKWDQNLVPGLVLYRRSEANRLSNIYLKRSSPPPKFHFRCHKSDSIEWPL